ncbi:MAG: hypothetical protein APF81_17760 [Desulfosporosinus sp. BRH_c37]|nr:MAG: hypothetical protein APF81_17760 [Desulfosporosinus sp. BRH_c37]
MEEILTNHKQYKDQILNALYYSRADGNGSINASDIRRIAGFDLNHRELKVYITELIVEKMVKGKNLYYITEKGIEYVENGFIKVNTQSDLSKLVEVNERQRELLESLLQIANLSLVEQQKETELMTQLTDALNSKNDNKARDILIKGLGISKEVGIPLMVEYFKSIIGL